MRQVRRWTRWLIPALLVVLLVSRLTGLAHSDAALPTLVAAEVLLSATFVVRLAMATRSARRQRRPGDSWEVTLETTIAAVTPGPFAGLAMSEVRVFVTLGRWLSTKMLRRPIFGFSYHRDLILIGWAMLFAVSSPAEMTLFHLLIPWPAVRWIILALEIYGLLWLLAIGVSFGTLRHQVSGEMVRLRLGLLADVLVPRRIIDGVVQEVHRTERNLGPDFDGDTATLQVNGKTNLVLGLTEPVRVRRLFGWTGPVRHIRFHADDPAAFIAALGSVGAGPVPGLPGTGAPGAARA